MIYVKNPLAIGVAQRVDLNAHIRRISNGKSRYKFTNIQPCYLYVKTLINPCKTRVTDLFYIIKPCLFLTNNNSSVYIKSTDQKSGSRTRQPLRFFYALDLAIFKHAQILWSNTFYGVVEEGRIRLCRIPPRLLFWAVETMPPSYSRVVITKQKRRAYYA